jgi:hypothetical protein
MVGGRPPRVSNPAVGAIQNPGQAGRLTYIIIHHVTVCQAGMPEGSLLKIQESMAQFGRVKAEGRDERRERTLEMG